MSAEIALAAMDAALRGDQAEALRALEGLEMDTERGTETEVFRACAGWAEGVRRVLDAAGVAPRSFWGLHIERADGGRVSEDSVELWAARFLVAGLNGDLDQQRALFSAIPAKGEFGPVPSVVSLLVLAADVVRPYVRSGGGLHP